MNEFRTLEKRIGYRFKNRSLLTAALTHPSPNHGRRQCAVEAICLHWSGGSFVGSRTWCQNPESKVSYHALIGPDGEVATLVPWSRAAWSVGKSQAPPPFTFGRLGNSATENIALSGGPRFGPPTAVQYHALVLLVARRMAAHRWGVDDLWRVVGHADLAIPRGRKRDPWGDDWLDRADIVRDLRLMLEVL